MTSYKFEQFLTHLPHLSNTYAHAGLSRKPNLPLTLSFMNDPLGTGKQILFPVQLRDKANPTKSVHFCPVFKSGLQYQTFNNRTIFNHLNTGLVSAVIFPLHYISLVQESISSCMQCFQESQLVLTDNMYLPFQFVQNLI